MKPADALRAGDACNMRDVSDKKFAKVYDEYYRRIRGFIRACVKDEFYTDDLTQETFIRARQHMGSLKDNGKIKSWLFRIAYNACQDHFRSVNGSQRRLTPLDRAMGLTNTILPDFQLEQQQMNACVYKHFQMLPKDYRTIIWLFDVQGFTHKEIAEILSIDVGNLKVRLHRARKKMKSILEKACQFERDHRNTFVCVPKSDLPN